MKERARMVEIKRDRKITKETDSQFLLEYQRAILLSLKADGSLDEAQYHYAEERLRYQMRNNIGNQRNDTGKGAEPW